jgi:peptidoglycan/xylan/chitin deacetylase (PgdA/CDA1 family)
MSRRLCLAVIWFLAAAAAATKPAPAAAPTAGDGSRVDKFWARAKKEIYRSPAELAAQRARELRKGLHYDVLYRGDRKAAVVAMTFDDGPHPDFTPRILAILRHYNVKGTFFVVGEMAAQYPGLIRAEKAAGHVIGNHTYHHVNLTKIPTDEIATEWQACQDVAKAVTGETMRFCRPPGGDYDSDVMAAATRLGLTTVLWTDDPGDYADPGDRVIENRVLARIGNGGIILIHDGVQQTIDVLPQIITILQKRGFRFATVAEMAAPRGGVTGEGAPASPRREPRGAGP